MRTALLLSCKGWRKRIILPSILLPTLTLLSCAAYVLLLTKSSKWRDGSQVHQGQEPTTNSCHFFQFKEDCILCSVSQTLGLFVKTNKAERMVDGQLQGKNTSQVMISQQWDASLVPCYWTALTAVTQGLKGGLDHESLVKFLYIHESRNLLETFHESCDWVMNRSSPSMIVSGCGDYYVQEFGLR